MERFIPELLNLLEWDQFAQVRIRQEHGHDHRSTCPIATEGAANRSQHPTLSSQGPKRRLQNYSKQFSFSKTHILLINK